MTAAWDAQKLGDVCAFLNRGVSPKYVEAGGIVFSTNDVFAIIALFSMCLEDTMSTQKRSMATDYSKQATFW